jgi:hypothetical protein
MDSVTISADTPASVTIALEWVPSASSGTGTFIYGGLTWTGVTPTTGTLTLEKVDGSVLKTADLLTGYSATSEFASIDAGFYLLTVRLETADKYAAKSEIVHIYAGLTTKISDSTVMSFTNDDFADFVAVMDITGVPSSATVGTGLALTGTVAPANATNQIIIWNVKAAGDTGATISGNTLNTTAAGTVVITATIVNGKTATTDFSKDFTITVSTVNLEKVATPTVSPVAGAVASGTEITLATTTAGADIYYTTNGSTPSKSNTKYTSKIAITSATTIKAIAVKDGMTDSDVLTAVYTISGSGTVPVSGVSLDKTTLTLTVGSTETLTATVAPDNATNKNVSWSSSNTSVAIVSNGTVSAVTAGTATITVTTAEGTKTATCAVTVNAATLVSIAITTQPTKTTYTVGESLDTAGMVVTATYSDNSTAAVTGYTTSGFNNNTAGTQDVTVSYTDGGVTKTATFSVTINPATGDGSVTITQPGASEADPILTVSSAEPAGGYTGNFTISASSGYTSYTWRLDGKVQTGQTNASFTVPVTTLDKGGHSVTLIAVKNDKSYSVSKNFKVQ